MHFRVPRLATLAATHPCVRQLLSRVDNMERTFRRWNREPAARDAQRLTRGFLGRRKAVRVHNARLRWAAVTIQKLVRKRIATGLLTRSCTAVILLQRVARKLGAQCRFSKIRAATNYLQACMRMWAATRGLSKWIKATTLIASVWRRYLVLAKTPIGKLLSRMRLTKLKMELKISELEESVERGARFCDKKIAVLKKLHIENKSMRAQKELSDGVHDARLQRLHDTEEQLGETKRELARAEILSHVRFKQIEIAVNLEKQRRSVENVPEASVCAASTLSDMLQLAVQKITRNMPPPVIATEVPTQLRVEVSGTEIWGDKSKSLADRKESGVITKLLPGGKCKVLFDHVLKSGTNSKAKRTFDVAKVQLILA